MFLNERSHFEYLDVTRAPISADISFGVLIVS
jgi:hypothetical protein